MCGRLRMKPTVSESNAFLRDGSATERIVGSSVANIRGDSQHCGASQRIEQCGLARIGVAHQRDRCHRHRLPPRPLLRPHSSHIFYLLFHMPDAPVNLPAVGFELGFTWAPGPDAAAQLRHFYSAPAQTRQHVLQLRQFHLQLAFARSRMFRENVEDELGAVNHPGVDQFLDVALLRSREVVIEQQQISGDRGGGAGNFLQLSTSDQRGRVGTVAAL